MYVQMYICEKLQTCADLCHTADLCIFIPPYQILFTVLSPLMYVPAFGEICKIFLSLFKKMLQCPLKCETSDYLKRRRVTRR